MNSSKIKKTPAEKATSKAESKIRTMDWSILLLTIWLTSRLFWSCDPSGFAFDYLWGLLGVLGAGTWFWFRKESFRRITSTDILVGIFFSLYIVSSLFGLIEGDKRAVLNCLWSATFWALVYTMVRQIVTTLERVHIVLLGFLCSAVILSTWAIYQRYVEYPRDKADYERNPVAVLQRVGIDPAEDSPARRSFEDRFFAFEPTASFSLTNSLAAFLTPWLILLGCKMMGGLVLVTEDRSENILLATRNSQLATFLLLGFALFLTHGRAAMLGIGTALMLYLLYLIIQSNISRIKKTVVTLFVIFCPIVGLVVVGIWKPSVFDSAILTLEYRFEYWETALQIISEHPLLGVGAGNFQNFYSMFMPATAGESVSDPHNFLLEFAAVAGIPVALIFWSILGWIGYIIAKRPDNVLIEEINSNCWKSAFIVTLTSTIIGYGIGFVAMEQLPGPFFVLILASLVAVFVTVPILDHVTPTPFLLSMMLLGLLLALMLSGGIGFTSIAIVFWTLCALIVNQTQGTDVNGNEISNEQNIQKCSIQSRFVTVGLMILFFLCFYTGFNPTLQSAQAKNASFNVSTPEEQLSYLEQATSADPMSFQPHFDIAQWYWMQWERTKDKTLFDSCVTEFKEAIKRNPRSGILWREYGIRLYKYGRQTGDYSQESNATDALEYACALHQADYIARAYLALQQMTTPILSKAQQEIYQTSLNNPQTSPETTEQLKKLLLKNQQKNARKWGKELILFSDSNPHQNRKIPATLKAELEKTINLDHSK